MQLTQMGRTGWDPFAEMRQLQAEMNRLFDNAGVFPAAQAYPPVNLWIGDSSVVVTAELPGLSAEDVELTIREDTLTMRGERHQVEEDEHAGWHRRERTYGTFSLTHGLPLRGHPDQV